MTARHRSACAAAVGLALVVLVVTVAAAGARMPGYGHRADLISELGARHARDGGLVTIAFAAVGLLLLGAAWCLRRTRPRTSVELAGAAVVLAVAIGYLVAGVARCEPGCLERGGDGWQRLHNLGGLVEYGGAALLLGATAVLLSRAGARGPAALTAGAGALLLVSSLGATTSDADAGAYQRIAEATAFAWLLGWTSRPTPSRSPGGTP